MIQRIMDEPPPLPALQKAVTFNAAVLLHERQPHRRYHLAADCMMMTSEVGMRSTPTGRSIRHFASKPQHGHVLQWDNVNPFTIGSRPLCLALSHSHLRGQSCLLAVGDSDGHLAVCDPIAGHARLHEFCPCLQVNDRIIYDVDWSKNDSFIATASADGTIRITALTECRLKPVLLLRSDLTEIKSVACHPMDANLLATGSSNGSLSVWDTRSRKTLCMLSSRLPLSQGQWSISPRRSVVPPLPVIAASLLGVHTVTGIEFLNENNMISSSANGQVCLWDTRNFSSPALILDGMYSMADVQLQTMICVRASPCRTRAAFLTTAGYCLVQALPQWTSAKTEINDCLAINLNLSPGTRLDNECKLNWSPCGRFLACGSNDVDKCIHIIDMTLGVVVLQMLGHTQGVNDVIWFQDRSGLISTSSDGLIRAWQPWMPRYGGGI